MENYFKRLESVQRDLLKELNASEKDIYDAGVHFANLSDEIANMSGRDEPFIKDGLKDFEDRVKDILDHLE